MTSTGPAEEDAPQANTAGRRQLAYAVVACLAGAGLALFAATRTWAVHETIRAAPLPPLDETSTGSDLAPWLPPLALVGLAGAGAVLATRGAGRRLVGVLVCGCGLAVLAGAVRGILDGTGVGWPALAGLGGALLVAGGALTVLRGRDWPAMGSRYDARVSKDSRRPPTDTLGTWTALDRGEDPTAD